MNTVIIELPRYVVIPRKTKKDKIFYINLNIYRNTHFHVLNEAKNIYSAIVLDRLQKKLKTAIKIRSISFVFYALNKLRRDLSNNICIHDKFFCDVLVNKGYIPDDDMLHIDKITYKYGGIDKENPRVDCVIEYDPLNSKPNKKEKDMPRTSNKIVITQTELIEILSKHLKKDITLRSISKSRATQEYTTTVDPVPSKVEEPKEEEVDLELPVEEEEEKPKKKGKKKKNKEEEVPPFDLKEKKKGKKKKKKGKKKNK